MTLDRPHPQALYRMYDAERRLLYVGITSSWPHRMSQHERDKAWWRDVTHIAMEWHPTRRAVEEAERRAIFTERPIHNVAGASELPVPRALPAQPDPFDVDGWLRDGELADEVVRTVLHSPLPVSVGYLSGYLGRARVVVLRAARCAVRNGLLVVDDDGRFSVDSEAHLGPWAHRGCGCATA